MSLSRREFLNVSVAAAASALLPATARSQQSETRPPGASPPAPPEEFTFVHLTDMHVTPKRWGDKGYRACIESVRDLKPRPAFTLMGGDLAFDGNYTPKPAFEEQIRLYKEVTRGLGFPHYNCMGNHDGLGWGSRRKVGLDDPDIGKKLIMDRLEWEKSHYSFDFAGWHFVVLDSIFPVQTKDGPSYEPRIGPEQLEWLADDLGAAGDKPKVALTHIAAFCNIGQMNGDPNAKAMTGMVIADTKDLREILERHKVLALLQGHSHKIEEYRLNDVWYLTSAAVSGAWWAGDWVGSPPGYTLFHCGPGGKLSWEHRTFPWEPHLEPEDDLERRKIAEFNAARQRQLELRERERAAAKH